MVGALNNYLNGVVYQLDDVVGTFANTHTASNALLGIHNGNAVFNVDRIFGANAGAVAIAKAGKGTNLIAVIQQVCGNAAAKALVVVFPFGCVAIAVAGNVCNLFNNILRFNAKDRRNVARGLIATGNTKVCCCFSTLTKRLCVTVTAGVSARAAVCTGQAFSDSGNRFVLFDTEEMYGKCEKDCANDCDDGKKDGRN